MIPLQTWVLFFHILKKCESNGGYRFLGQYYLYFLHSEVFIFFMLTVFLILGKLLYLSVEVKEMVAKVPA